MSIIANIIVRRKGKIDANASVSKTGNSTYKVKLPSIGVPFSYKTMEEAVEACVSMCRCKYLTKDVTVEYVTGGEK